MGGGCLVPGDLVPGVSAPGGSAPRGVCSGGCLLPGDLLGEGGGVVGIPACTEADTPWERRLLLRTVRILLECILVIKQNLRLLFVRPLIPLF